MTGSSCLNLIGAPFRTSTLFLKPRGGAMQWWAVASLRGAEIFCAGKEGVTLWHLSDA
jgi:hypothetical protein